MTDSLACMIFSILSRFSTSEFLRPKRLFFCLNLISFTWFQPKAQGQTKLKEKVASRENIRQWKTGFKLLLFVLISGLCYK